MPGFAIGSAPDGCLGTHHRGLWVQGVGSSLKSVKDFQFVPFRLPSLGFAPPNTLIKGCVPWLGVPNPQGAKEKIPKFRAWVNKAESTTLSPER